MAARYCIHPEVAWRHVDGAVFLLTADGRYHQTEDAVGVFLWQALAAAPAGAALDTLVEQLRAEFEVDAATARADVRDFLERLVEAGALQFRDEVPMLTKDGKNAAEGETR